MTTSDSLSAQTYIFCKPQGQGHVEQSATNNLCNYFEPMRIRVLEMGGMAGVNVSLGRRRYDGNSGRER